MRIGFTGTRKGMTGAQKLTLRWILMESNSYQWEFHHGDCTGGDDEAHDIAVQCDLYPVIHPPVNNTYRAFKQPGQFGRILAPKGYLPRNRDIVADTEILFGAPAEDTEQPIGGTWYTIRYAIRIGRPIRIILPNGEIRDGL